MVGYITERARDGGELMAITTKSFPVVGEGYYDSALGLHGVPAVVDSNYSTVHTGDKVWVYSASASTCGSSVTYAQVSLTFRGA